MRMSQLFSQTLREAPAEAEIPSHRLLIRAGFIRQLAAGVYTIMPLARRALTKIENIMREEMNAIGGQELTMPVIHPAEIWQETGRWYQIGSEMGRFKDKNEREMVLAMTHEEVVTDLARKEIRSYRQLPVLIYQIQTKWRDDPRPRAGLIRLREFIMKDSYSLDSSWLGLDQQYRNHYQAYFNIFHRCGIEVLAVKSDSGMMGGKIAHEFMYITPHGEDTILLCNECGYTANRQVAVFKKPVPIKVDEKELEKVATPNTKTIADLARFLNIPESQTAKAIFFVATIAEEHKTIDKFIFAILRGDMELNETKLVNLIKALKLRPADEEEIKAIGAVPGYASPINLAKKDESIRWITVVDDLIPQTKNLVAGANEDGFHLLNTNYGRDYNADIIADITVASDGDTCVCSQAQLKAVRGVEVGNIFQLGTRYSAAMGATFQDEDGSEKPIIMGSYGIGSGRLLAAIAEEHNDDFGLIWPITVSPFHIHIVMLPHKKDQGETKRIANQLYEKLQTAGLDVFFDDRNESPGVKFNDADLIGIPLRLTVSARGVNEGVIELKRRDQDKNQKRLIPISDVVAVVNAEIDIMESEIKSKVIEIPFDI